MIMNIGPARAVVMELEMVIGLLSGGLLTLLGALLVGYGSFARRGFRFMGQHRG